MFLNLYLINLLEKDVINDEIPVYEEKPNDLLEPNISQEEEITPQLFSDEADNSTSSESKEEETLQSEEDEDFEIPAFLRKQKF